MLHFVSFQVCCPAQWKPHWTGKAVVAKRGHRVAGVLLLTTTDRQTDRQSLPHVGWDRDWVRTSPRGGHSKTASPTERHPTQQHLRTSFLVAGFDYGLWNTKRWIMLPKLFDMNLVLRYVLPYFLFLEKEGKHSKSLWSTIAPLEDECSSKA